MSTNILLNVSNGKLLYDKMLRLVERYSKALTSSCLIILKMNKFWWIQIFKIHRRMYAALENTVSANNEH